MKGFQRLFDAFCEEKIERVDYVLIDVEGKEPNVIRGIKLDSMRHVFPVFQYELGGTWTDSRHDENQWSQYGVAMYLKALGYKLFLIGAKNNLPELLEVEPEFFRIFCHRPEAYVDGNMLALHRSFAAVGLLSYLEAFVAPTKTSESCR